MNNYPDIPEFSDFEELLLHSSALIGTTLPLDTENLINTQTLHTPIGDLIYNPKKSRQGTYYLGTKDSRIAVYISFDDLTIQSIEIQQFEEEKNGIQSIMPKVLTIGINSYDSTHAQIGALNKVVSAQAKMLLELQSKFDSLDGKK